MSKRKRSNDSLTPSKRPLTYRDAIIKTFRSLVDEMCAILPAYKDFLQQHFDTIEKRADDISTMVAMFVAPHLHNIKKGDIRFLFPYAAKSDATWMGMALRFLPLPEGIRDKLEQSRKYAEEVAAKVEESGADWEHMADEEELEKLQAVGIHVTIERVKRLVDIVQLLCELCVDHVKKMDGYAILFDTKFLTINSTQWQA